MKLLLDETLTETIQAKKDNEFGLQFDACFDDGVMKLKNKCDRLRKERDEARRDACEQFAKIYNPEQRHDITRAYAKKRNWDCYEKE